MNDDLKAKRNTFYEEKADFGSLPADRVLTTEERKLSAISMAVNAAMIQLILEGFFDQNQSLHFMAHLQDFANRLYNGEGIKMPGAFHTLKLDSQSGQLYADASEDALKNGSANFVKFKDAVNELNKMVASETGDNEGSVNAKPTVH